MRKKYKNFREKVRSHFHNILRTKHGVHSIAIGFAIGTFITILPTPGLNILLGLLIILIFPTVNKYALFTSYFVFNGIVKSFIYLLAYTLGKAIFHRNSEILMETTFIEKSILITKNSLVGILILDIIISVASYYIVYSIVKRYRNRKHLTIRYL